MSMVHLEMNGFKIRIQPTITDDEIKTACRMANDYGKYAVGNAVALVLNVRQRSTGFSLQRIMEFLATPAGQARLDAMTNYGYNAVDLLKFEAVLEAVQQCRKKYGMKTTTKLVKELTIA